jgi:hypothetical protein
VLKVALIRVPDPIAWEETPAVAAVEPDKGVTRITAH